MDQEIKTKLTELELKINDIYTSVEKTRKYFRAMIWLTVIFLVLPMIGMVFAIPVFLNNYVGALSGLGL